MSLPAVDRHAHARILTHTHTRTLLLLQHKKETPLIQLTHTKKFNTLREGVDGPNLDILNRERCDDTGF